MHELIEKIDNLFRRHGSAHYGPEPVTLLHHSMQCADLARSQMLGDKLVVSAGLHDIGHLLILDDGEPYGAANDHHERLGADFLEQYLPAAIVNPIRWHVEAKRFLVATEPAYRTTLSAGSIASLIQQGGAMTEAEMQTFRAIDGFRETVHLRRLDDQAKAPGAPGMVLGDFLWLVERYVSARGGSQ